MNDASRTDRLTSWKAIANHLGCSVRTARRWEAQESLPVHRHMHSAQATVFAFKAELDAWRSDTAVAPRKSVESTPDRSRVSIAVLPFEYLGGGEKQEDLADGFTDEIISDLSKIRRLRVISRTSSMALRGSRKDARAIGRDLRVDYLLEGTVRRQDSQLRVAVRLIHAADDDPRWVENYDGSLDDVFSIQQDIARDIAGELRVQLTEGDERRLSEQAYDDVDIWRAALQARQAALRWRKDAIDHAVRLLSNALDKAPDNVEVLAALGRAWLQYREAGIDSSEEPLRQAAAYAQRALDLDPTSPASLQLKAWLSYAEGRISDAVRDLQASLENDWSNPDTLGLLCNCYLISGRPARAQPLIEQLIAIDPLTPLTRCLPGWAAVLEGRMEEAIGPYREMFEMDPGNPMGRLFYVWVLTANGRTDEARQLAESVPDSLRATPPIQIVSLLAGASASPSTSETPAIDAMTEQIVATSDIFPRFIADAYALAGDTDRALHWLELAMDRGFINYPYLAKHNRLLVSLHDDEGFQGLLERARKAWESFDA